MPRPKQYDDALADALIAAAAAALAVGGPDALSLRSVAVQAGTSTNAVYTLFGGRDELIAATVARARESFTAAQAAALPVVEEADDAAVDATEDAAGGSTRALGVADLRALGRAYRAWALAHPALYAVMFGPAMSVPGGDCTAVESREGPEQGLAPLLAVVRSLLASGTFTGPDATTVAVAIWAATHGAVSLEMSQWPGAPFAEATFETQLDAVERAWRA